MNTPLTVVGFLITVTAIGAINGFGMSFFPTGLDRDFPRFSTSLATKINPPNPVDENEYPFIVYFRTDARPHICTGSLIASRWVLSAAHCPFIPNTIYAVIGDFDRASTSGTEQVIQIEEAYKYPGFIWEFNSDIALVKLASPVNMSSKAVGKVTSLTSQSYLEKVRNNEKKCKVLGMGITNNGNTWILSDVLQQQDIRIVSDEVAETRNMTSHPTVLFAENQYENECKRGSVCNGDSGGPVICRKGSGWVQVGVTSFGFPPNGCRTGTNGYTNVQYFKTWIKKTMKN